MWTINSFDVLHLRTPGGDRFTEFVDAQIRAQAFLGGLPDAEVRTNLRTNIPDGGVDTEVRQPMPSDSTGWFGVPTCWQYKATEARNISENDLRTEVRKPYARSLIPAGYGYRLCICDDFPPDKQAEWLRILTEEVRAINPGAPAPAVIVTSALAEWASRFPAVVIRFFRPALEHVLHLRAWGQSITSSTRQFVDVAAWAPVRQRLLEHLDWSRDCPDVVVSLEGEAGVGKTRLVYEVLTALSGSDSVVLYTLHEQVAERVASALANDATARAILVADECSRRTRLRLSQILRGHRGRVRVIALDNTGSPPPAGAEASWMERIPDETVARILAENFPDVPEARRREYVRFSRGFVRLAADLGREDPRIATAGQVGPALLSVSDYLRARLTEEHLTTLAALALLWRVGLREDVAEELTAWCRLLGLDRQSTVQLTNALRDVPGFVGRAGRFFHVTPEIVAQVAYEEGWRRWIEHDPSAFLAQIPEGLLQPFLRRTAASAPPDARRVVGEFFRAWAVGLQPADLTDRPAVERLAALVDTDPETFLPLLRRLIERASLEELRRVTRDYREGGWGPRRILVWLAERMAQFPEHFRHAEAVMRRLALAESEPTIGNNATILWRQLFRVFLSGTAVPFPERLRVLEERLLTGTPEEWALGFAALGDAFDTLATRLMAPTVVSGRFVPGEWSPTTSEQYRDCLLPALDLLRRLTEGDNAAARDAAQGVAIRLMRTVLAAGFLKQVRPLFPAGRVAESVLPRLIEAVESFLSYEGAEDRRPGLLAAYLADVRQWRQSLQPADLHGRLVSVVGMDRWHHSVRGGEAEWLLDIERLAVEVRDRPEFLPAQLPWLCSDQARSAAVLGDALGRCDVGAACLDAIVSAAVGTGATGFAAAYIRALLRSHPGQAEAVNRRLDEAEARAPEAAFGLALGGGDAARAVERALRLVDAGALRPEFLRGFLYGVGMRQLTSDEFREVLTRLARGAAAGNRSLLGTAITFLAWPLLAPQAEDRLDRLADDEVRALAWALLTATFADGAGDPHAWRTVLGALAGSEAETALRLAACAAMATSADQREEASAFLVERAQSFPDLVMHQLGSVLLEEQGGWRPMIAAFGPILRALPPAAVEQWLRSAGVAGARLIARHLPRPSVGEDGQVVVPELTAFVLEQFGGDEDTFRQFCTGAYRTEVYSGDIAAEMEREPATLRRFLDHPLPRIREWAEGEIRSTEANARHWRRRDEEDEVR
jgi:hypothetical protein